LIHAAAGGVGTPAVRPAKEGGAHVIGTASAWNRDFPRGLGLDQVTDHNTGRFEERVKPVDLVFDTMGGETRGRS